MEELRRAVEADVPALNALMHASRAYDGDYRAMLDGYFVTPAQVARDLVVLAERGGELRVRPQKNGPLKLEGPLELVSGGNRTLDRMESVNLCRCGHSGNKPYCDGSHKKVGFEAEGE